jgi:hypothetical protein
MSDIAPSNGLPIEDAFHAAFGESISQTLDLETWRHAGRLGDLYGQLQQEIAGAQEHEIAARDAIRKKVFPQLRTQENAPKCAGVYRTTERELESIQRGLLFNGAVEACNGVAVTHESLALSITQVGVCLVSYQADRGSWVHRLYRRDLRESIADPTQLASDLINRRHRHDGDDPATTIRMSELSRRSLLSFAERATLVELSDVQWRMGRGQPAPYELLTGSGSPDLILASIDMLKRLILNHQMFVFVTPSLSQRGLLTIGDALKPLEYAVISTMTEQLRAIVFAGHFSKEIARTLTKFVNEIGPNIVVGCYRASDIGPARIFYAHVDHAHEAAQLAMADSRLQQHRAYPLLLDLAGEICRTSFGSGDFIATLRDAYTGAGQPYAFHQEFGLG